MTWKELLAQKRVERVPAGEGEIEGLLTLSARALADALIIAMTPEGRYDRAYDAARTLATAVVRSCGYRVKAVGGGHYNTFGHSRRRTRNNLAPTRSISMSAAGRETS